MIQPGRLDENEWAQVWAHAAGSGQILERLHGFSERAFVAAAHHERLDGMGYPHGLAADRIPLETRIITVADIFDAITAERPYRGPIPVADAIAIDGACLDALIHALPELGF
ncbi:MAG: HD-GYP domain-containing protein [Thiobacillus sp.]